MNPHCDLQTTSWPSYHNLETAYSTASAMPNSIGDNLVDWEDRLEIIKSVLNDEPLRSQRPTSNDYALNQEKNWDYETGNSFYPNNNISDKPPQLQCPLSSKSFAFYKNYPQPLVGPPPLHGHVYDHSPLHEDPTKPRKRGRPRKYPENKSRKRGRTQPILFEFLLEVLDNPTYAECVSWVERHRGTFKFNSEKKEEIAMLWGKKKGNRKPMSYQKMARALRDYRQKGILQKIRKKLHYQFLDQYIPK